MRWTRWLSITGAAAVVAVVGGPWVYINLIRAEAPPPLTSTSTGGSAPDTSGGGATVDAPEGTWAVSDGSLVGYRVQEILFGQSATAVGRTSEVDGTLEVSGTTISAASFTTDLTTVRSDEKRRDNQFHGRIMQTATYPEAAFELTQPIAFEAKPPEGESVSRSATGKLTLHGVTKTVTFPATGKFADGAIVVSGSIPITFTDWGISNPSGGPARTEDHGILEFALKFTPA